jgi:hypothetical protein
MPSSEVAPVARERPPEAGTERETLAGLLDFLRSSVVNKVAGLTDEQASSAPIPPSSLTAAGLVKHLTGVERFWFSIDFAGADVSFPWTDTNPHGNFALDEDDTLRKIVAEYISECERSRRACEFARLEDQARGAGMTFTLRFAFAHMIEETARYCGHLDLLRERIDGTTGE